MVPLESELPDASESYGRSGKATGASSASLPASSPRGSDDEGAAAPISKLSKMAMKDALLELEVAARKTRDVSSAAVLQLWQKAEQKLGLEVEIDDPALGGLFSVHVLAVEELCNQVRAQAQAMLTAAELMNSERLSTTANDLRILSDSKFGDNSSLGQSITGDLEDASESVSQAYLRLKTRLRNEVLGVIDQRIQSHDHVRELIRQRQRARTFGTSARMMWHV
eukprot:TRINITY_DN3361_c0_g2_i1.p1 TRINITY_DN3361_c0_g2~~TRINITY_DN3361_c0_g2_i1.p1  ORF type:complete len:236 (+),score=59.59 TRINITY_DN3361_c0_g2_i1:38-709(+)